MRTSLLLLMLSISLFANSEYDSLLSSIKVARKSYAKRYSASNYKAKQKLIKEVRAYLQKTLQDELFPHWYNTEWDFYGRTNTPRKGKIACGYFVTHTLRDLGFAIPYTRWAQLASESFMKQFIGSELKRFSGNKISALVSYLKTKGKGIYLVGLDCHVGYIVVSDEIWFVHSSYYHPQIGVMQEPILSEHPLFDSNYHVIGTLFSDQMVLNWLMQKRY